MPALTAHQAAALERWLPGHEVVEDLSWGQTDTVVLHLRTPEGDRVAKAGGRGNHHIDRELRAHGGHTSVWVESGRAARLLRRDSDARVFVLEWLAGELVDATAAALDPGIHRQAGELLRAFHAQSAVSGHGAEAAATRRAIEWLDSAHRIDAETEERLRAVLAVPAVSDPPLVPTHGDFQPRNWVVDAGLLRVIDFGRFDLRPAVTDFARLAAQQWKAEPATEAAFFEGYGADPRAPDHWRLVRIREAIGTAVWAHRVGDEEFEAQGHRMITEALA